VFVWDEQKNESNRRKHGVTFETAAIVIDDPLSITSLVSFEKDEPRWQTIGTIGGATALLVVHVIEDNPEEMEVIRIISARHITNAERRQFESLYNQHQTQVLGHAANPNDRGWFGPRGYRARRNGNQG
jgi:uncharacterized DUF497 family protein